MSHLDNIEFGFVKFALLFSDLNYLDSAGQLRVSVVLNHFFTRPNIVTLFGNKTFKQNYPFSHFAILIWNLNNFDPVKKARTKENIFQSGVYKKSVENETKFSFF